MSVSTNAPFRYKEKATSMTNVRAGTQVWYLALESTFRTVYNYWGGEHEGEFDHALIKDPKRNFLGTTKRLTRERIVFWFNGVIRYLTAHIDDLVFKLDESDKLISNLRVSDASLHREVRNLRTAIEIRDGEIQSLRFALTEISKLHAKEDPMQMEPW